MQVQSAVGLVTVQENRDAGNGDVGQAQGDQDHLPPRKVEQAVAHPLDHRIQKSPIRQQHEFVFLRTPDFRQYINFKFFSRQKTAVSTEPGKKQLKTITF